MPSGPRKVTGLKPEARLRLPPLVRPWLCVAGARPDLQGTLPGVVNDMHHDLAALKRVGISHLITLTERDLPQDALKRHGLANLHLPIRDHEAPSLGQIQMLLGRMETLMAQGEVLAVHYLAGRGRTGTVLAAWRIREGLTAQEALRRVRLLDAHYVQSAEQEAFLRATRTSSSKDCVNGNQRRKTAMSLK